jgi:hypothetical protein
MQCSTGRIEVPCLMVWIKDNRSKYTSFSNVTYCKTIHEYNASNSYKYLPSKDRTKLVLSQSIKSINFVKKARSSWLVFSRSAFNNTSIGPWSNYMPLSRMKVVKCRVTRNKWYARWMRAWRWKLWTVESENSIVFRSDFGYVLMVNPKLTF